MKNRLTIFWYSKEHETIDLECNQCIQVSQNHITIYHWNVILDKPITDRKLKFDVFHDTFIVSFD